MARHTEAFVVLRRLAEQRTRGRPVARASTIEEHHRAEATDIDLLQPMRKRSGLLRCHLEVILGRRPFAGPGGGDTRGGPDEARGGPGPDRARGEELERKVMQRRHLLMFTEDGE